MLEAKRQGITVFALILPVLFLAAVHAMTFSTIRYSIPTIPVLSILQAAGLRAIVHALNERWGLSLGVSWVRWLKTALVGSAARSYRGTAL
jgi:ABC-type dipeptide/oligopeptide/nickel transport system permease component